MYKQRALSVQLGSFFMEYSQRTSRSEKKKKKCVLTCHLMWEKATTKQKVETAVIMSRQVFNLWLGHFRHERQMFLFYLVIK